MLSRLLVLLLFLMPAAGLARERAPGPDNPAWAFEASDVPVEPQYRFGRLENGLRYVVRANSTPAGTALVRMEVAAGSLDERDDERGFAHFVEHMAFNGSARVAEGEMVRLLERHGLAFGADTNAATTFETTTYRLDLPRAEPALLDTALMLLRETASELAFSPEAVERERGVLLSELRDRNTWAMRNALDHARFLHPRARWPARFPVGEAATIASAPAEALQAFWRREYVPSRTTVVVIGDFEPALVEERIRAAFASWTPTPAEPLPEAGPVETRDKGRVGIHLDPALSERVTVSRHGKWLDEPDTLRQRREDLLRAIGNGVINRRLARLSRLSDPPFRDAGFGTAPVFHAGRTTNLVIDTIDGKWRAGLLAAGTEVRRALKFGFAPAEIAEQLAGVRTATRNAAARAPTRSNAALEAAVFALLRDDVVPSDPQGALDRLEAFVAEIKPARVLSALRREAVPFGKRPLIRFQGRRAPQGAEQAIRASWKQAMRAKLAPPDEAGQSAFAYTGFGPAGTVTSDKREPMLAIRQVRFANGVRLNIRRTELDRDVVWVQTSVDGGNMLATRGNPLATQMVGFLAAGGLGRHSEDELQSLLAGHAVDTSIRAAPDTFVATARTTPDDLALQLRLHAAFLSDPGFRAEAEQKYRLDINNWFSRARATPGAALSADSGGILSDGDPRFTLQRIEDYRALTFARLKENISDRLARGAIEIGVVGDIDEEAVISAVAATLAALPAREREFLPYAAERTRAFTARRGIHVIEHEGAADQAMIQMVWPTRDDADPPETLRLEMLERVVRLRLTESLRENLGKAYSPSASSAPSRVWTGYGTFSVTAAIDVHELEAARTAIREAIAGLRVRPASDDEMLRARQPLIEAHENALKSNAGWLSLVDRAQTEPDRIERFQRAKERLSSITARDLQAMAVKYLDPDRAVEIDVLPARPAPTSAP